MSTPSQLDAASKCYCFNDAEFKRVVAYLLDQINSGGGGGTVQDMQVAWTPTNVKLGELMGFAGSAFAGISTITFNQTTLTNTINFAIGPMPQMFFPNLTNAKGIYFSSVSGVSLSLPKLTTLSADLDVDTTNDFTSLSAPLLQSIGGELAINNNSALTTLHLPSLTTVGTDIFNELNTSLSDVQLPVYLPTNGQPQNFHGCALSATSVNHILARCVANVGYVSGTVDLAAGTNAAPSGQGIADKATLIGRGCTVNTN